MGLVALATAFVAGLLTALSPCVLPVLPLVMGSAASSRYGPVALAAGFVTTFTAVGLLLASVGPALGLSDTFVRNASAVLLMAAGASMLSRRLHDLAGRWLSPLASASARVSPHAGRGAGGQFLIGATLGGVWSPCVGPTLGAALGLAARSDTAARAAAIMAAFGLGSAALLLAAGYGSRAVIGQRGALLRAGERGRLAFGVLLLVVGVSVVSGTDKLVEAMVLTHLPDWWIDMIAGA
ncbi:MAG: cytochrome c biogenesis CcdA family protein [Vicinamibacterales bacterium]